MTPPRAYDMRQILPTVQDACDCLIENGFSQKVYMRINDDGTVTLVDYDAYVDGVLAQDRAAREDDET